MKQIQTYKLLVMLVMALALPISARQRKREKAPEEGATSITVVAAAVVNLRPDDLTTMVAGRADASGGVRGENTISGFNSPDAAVMFSVIAPREDDFVVGVIFSSPETQTMEVRCGESVLSAPSIPKTWEGRPIYWRQEFPGLLHLKKGENQITFRLPDAKPSKSGKAARTLISKEPKQFTLWSIELGTPAARKAQLERAQEMRSDASWMVEGKYGLFVHWSALSQAYQGDKPRAEWFQKSVEMFDVKVFADAVERAGAAWVTFTATHKGFYWPGPSEAIDRIEKGRTTQRDLLGEIIDELARRDIRTLFYLHTGYNGYEAEAWREVVGAKDADTQRYSDNIEAILRECSLRYGKRLSGFGYIDGCLQHDYPLDPHWESWARAIKAGNPDALIGFSSNRGPTVSPFSDISTTDGGGSVSEPAASQIGPGKQLGDVTPAWWCHMDTWFIDKPLNGKFSRSPHRSAKEYVDYFKMMEEKKIPVTMNLAMTADVVADHPIFNPECMAVMEEVRKAIRGK